MLKHVPPFMDAELLWILAAMGHGDELAVVDRNFPAQSTADCTASGKLVTLAGLNAPEAVADDAAPVEFRKRQLGLLGKSVGFGNENDRAFRVDDA